MSSPSSSKDVHVLNFRSGEHVISRGRRDFTDVITSLGMERFSGLYSCSQCNHGGPYKSEEGRSELVLGDVITEERGCSECKQLP